METKHCGKCKIEKELNEFCFRIQSKDGRDYSCKECNNKSAAEWRKNNKDYIKKYSKKLNSDVKHNEKMKQYYLDNKGEYKKRSKEYKNNNKEKILQYNRNYFPKRYNENIQYKISQLLRTKLYLILNGQKRESFMKLLGCPLTELKLWLEQQFLPEMSWDNHGVIWEIDHIKACASFDLTDIEQQKECFYYTNLQPLFKTTEIAESLGYKNYIGNRNKNKF